MKKRVEWIDMAKGYGIILVIVGHIPIEKFLKHWIYSFHMPLFFFLAGYVFKKETLLKEFMIKRIRGLIVPYFLLGLGIIVFNIFLTLYVNTFNHFEVLRQIKSLIIQKRFLSLWFLTCLFSLNIMFYFIMRLKLNDLIVSILVIVLAVLGIVYYEFGGKPLIWNIDVCLTASPFFWLGYLYKKYAVILDEKIRKINKILLTLLLLFASIFLNYIFNSPLEMYSSRYGTPIYTYCVALVGIFLVIEVSKLKINNYIKFIGENTLIYYGWHQSIVILLSYKVLEIFKLFFSKLVTLKIEGNIYKSMQVMIILLILTILTRVILNTKLKIILGK